MTTKTKRKPRFLAVPPEKPVVQIQSRDAELLRWIYRYRFLRTSQIVSLVRPLFPGAYGADAVKRRLRKLFDENYIRRPPSQRRFLIPGSGNPETVYALGNNGAAVLEKWFGIPRGKVEWTSKNNRVGQDHIEHSLLIADVMVALELACRRSRSVALIRSDDILSWAPEETRRHSSPFEWRVRTRHLDREWTVPVRPDGMFGLQFSDGTSAFFFLEADRGTMTVEPTVKAPWKSCIYRKFVGYYATWLEKEHTKRFGVENFRTLFVVETRCAHQRIESFIESNRNVCNGEGFEGFLFADYETLLSQPLLEALWLNGRNEYTQLTE